MKENEDKNLEQFVARVMKETPLESPSYNFTSTVMTHVLAIDKSKATTYKPLISRTGWILIFAGVAAVLLYLLLSDTTQTANRPWLLNLTGKRINEAINSSTLFQFSRLIVNVIVAAAVLVLVQLALLKNYLDKRLLK